MSSDATSDVAPFGLGSRADRFRRLLHPCRERCFGQRRRQVMGAGVGDIETWDGVAPKRSQPAASTRKLGLRTVQLDASSRLGNPGSRLFDRPLGESLALLGRDHVEENLYDGRTPVPSHALVPSGLRVWSEMSRVGRGCGAEAAAQ